MTKRIFDQVTRIFSRRGTNAGRALSTYIFIFKADGYWFFCLCPLNNSWCRSQIYKIKRIELFLGVAERSHNKQQISFNSYPTVISIYFEGLCKCLSYF